ncbi:hypothetical protein F5882DRAFT_461569 [Hyaloscypha sp. PMI_1271]|nr:hypothetical protein F5882DRAFT_461569 [Hyaloscypha sp. PMI_1271]
MEPKKKMGKKTMDTHITVPLEMIRSSPSHTTIIQLSPDIELGVSYEVQIKAPEDGTLGRNVPASGIPTSQIMAMYKVDFEAGFEALSERDWQGHLVSRCVTMGSEHKEESDDSESDSEAQRKLGDHQKTQA